MRYRGVMAFRPMMRARPATGSSLMRRPKSRAMYLARGLRPGALVKTRWVSWRAIQVHQLRR